MIKNAAKLLYTIAGAAVVAAIAFAMFTGGHEIGMDSILGPLSLGWKGYVGNHVAYAVLLSIAVTALGLGVLVSTIADGDAEDAARLLQVEEVPAPAPVERANFFPVLGALSLVLLVLGLATGPVMFVIGGFLLGITVIEWTVRAWSERASGDQELNRHLRASLLNAFEFPAFGVLVLFAVAAAMWRIMTVLPIAGAIVIFSAVPAIILGFGAYLSTRRRISQSVVAGVIVIGAAALIIGAVVASVVGESDEGALGPASGPAVVIEEGR